VNPRIPYGNSKNAEKTYLSIIILLGLVNEVSFAVILKLYPSISMREPLSCPYCICLFQKCQSICPSFGYQATNEIIQNLVQKGLIERDTLDYIRLTQKGLDKCEENCR
jgi:hypothetical protein